MRARRDGEGRALAALVRWRTAERQAVRLALADALEAEGAAEAEAAARASEEVLGRREVARLAARLARPGPERGPVEPACGAGPVAPARADELARLAAEAAAAARRVEEAGARAASAAGRLRSRREATEAARCAAWRAKAAAEAAAGALAGWRADRRRAREQRAEDDGPGR